MDSSETPNLGNATAPAVIPTVSETVHSRDTTQQVTEHTEERQPLKALRTLRKYSQQTLAKAMNTSQGEISRIEKRKDMHISTLRSYIQAIGGEVVILARFPNDEVVQVTI